MNKYDLYKEKFNQAKIPFSCTFNEEINKWVAATMAKGYLIGDEGDSTGDAMEKLWNRLTSNYGLS